MAKVALAAIPNWASSGHLRRCSDADTTNKYLSRDKEASILSRPTFKEPQFFPTTCLSRPQGSATASPYPITGYVPTGEFLKGVGDTC
eukprot:scaffold9592_cov109-Skeletonema_dohrnii-CCMP3373.AAC.1